MPQLHNKADVTGIFDEVTVTDFSELSVELSAVSIEKTADKAIWVKGELTYTLVVTNIDESIPGMPLDDVLVVDIIDPDLARLVTGSVAIDGVAALPNEFTYNPTTGELTVLLGTIIAGAHRTITFRVETP